MLYRRFVQLAVRHFLRRGPYNEIFRVEHCQRGHMLGIESGLVDQRFAGSRNALVTRFAETG